MLADKDKISQRQALFLFISTVFTSAIHFIPSSTVQKAKQAAYLAPLITLAIFILLILLIHKTYKKFGDGSILDIICKILGPFIGKIIIILYCLWLTVFLGLFVRYYAERLVSSIFPYTSISIFIIIMLILVAAVLHAGIVTLARMNEIILPIVTIVTYTLIAFILPQIEVRRLTPISYVNFIPIMDASWGVTTVWGYVTYIFFIGDEINNKERIAKEGMKVSIFIWITTTLLIAAIVGSLGHSVAIRTPFPFMAAVKLVSVFGILEKIESIVVVVWILTDFITIALFTYINLKAINQLFDLRDVKPFINIYMVFIYILSMYICNSRFELEDFSQRIATPISVLLSLVIPTIVFGIGLIRKSPQNR